MRRRTLLTTALAAGAVTLPARPALAAPATRFGVIASTQGPPKDDADTFRRLYEQQRVLYGGGPIGIRLFGGDRLPLAGDGGMVGNLLAWAAARHPDEPITISHKTRDEGRLRTLLDWAQAHRVRLSVIYFHEVQNDWCRHRDARAEPAVYLDTYRAYRRIIQAHPAHRQVTLEKNLMWYWQHYNAKKLGGDWRLFVERNDPADVVSWDTYVFPGMPPTFPHSDHGRYAMPDEFFRYPRDVWRETGRPWGVGEIGTTVQDGAGVGAEAHWDRGGARFTEWVGTITAAAANPAAIGREYAGLPPALFMKWWAAPDADGSEQGLQQVPAAVAAYRKLVRSAPLT
jgi:hypothetical protein